MLDNIISLVKDKVGDMVGGEAGVPQEKKNAVVETTTSSIIEGLKSYATPENISSLTSLFGHGSAASESSPAIKQSGITQGIQSNVISNLVSKVGLNQGTANSIATMVVPAVMAMLAKKTSDGSSSGFNIGSLVSAFTGGGSSAGDGEGILEKVGSFFGK